MTRRDTATAPRTQYRLADIRPRHADGPTSLNTAEQTVEVVWSKGAAVARTDPWTGERYIEELDLAGVNLSRLNAGAPFLQMHEAHSLGGVIGSVVPGSAVVRGDSAVATIRMSDRADAAGTWDDIRAGHIRAVSVGYQVEKFEVEPNASGPDTWRATSWTPFEISAVVIGADPQAMFRGAAPHTTPHHDKETTMHTSETAAPTAEANRAAAIAESTRVEGIRDVANRYGVTADITSALITDGISVENARDQLQNRAADISDSTAPRRSHCDVFAGGRNENEQRAEAMADAIFTRLNPSHVPSEQARQYVYRSLPELARESLRAAGVRGQFSTNEIVTRALHGTSDFPLLLGNVIEKELRTAYATGFGGVRSIAQVTSVRDFRTKAYLNASTDLGLELVNEHGEFKSGTIAESGENIAVKTFGKIFGVTRQAIVNDDLGALQRIGDIASESARSLEADTVVALLTANSGAGPAMTDGVKLFHTASHKNLAGTGTIIDLTSVGAAVAAMRGQVNLSGKAMGIEPRFIVVSAAKEMIARQLFSTTYVPVTSATTNPFQNIEVIVDPRLDAASLTRWYLVGAYDGLLAAYLEGVTGPQVDTKAGFEVDGVQIRVRLDFGAAFVDHRGWYCNPGA